MNYKKLYVNEEGIDYTKFDVLPESAFEKVRGFLLQDGINFFKEHFEKEGDLISLHIIGGGMQVRNFIKFEGEFKGWDQDDLDNLWSDVVLKSIQGSN